MNIIIAGLAKNCEKSLDSNLVYLDYLNSKYKEKIKLSIFIVENDSNDNTKLTLQVKVTQDLYRFYNFLTFRKY
mgnify:CR=1 FL=1